MLSDPKSSKEQLGIRGNKELTVEQQNEGKHKGAFCKLIGILTINDQPRDDTKKTIERAKE